MPDATAEPVFQHRYGMKTSRRTFIQTAVAFPGIASLISVSSHAEEQKPSGFDPWVEVHAGHLRHNVQEVARRVSGRPILAVIKNNGYGLGIANVARILEPMTEVQGFAVIKFQEAVVLRDAGVRKPVLLLGPFDESEFEEAVALKIMPMVYTDVGSWAENASRKLQKKVPVHICVDTGIGRVGVSVAKALPLTRQLASLKSIEIAGIMMTFTEDPEFDKEQFTRFENLCASLQQSGITVGKKHAVSSYGLFQHPDMFLDMVRPGMALYGVYPDKEFRESTALNLLPAVSLKTRIIYTKQLKKGESAGYNRVFVAKEDTWVATLPAGHADGIPREVTKGGRIRIFDGMYPAVAISASHCIVDLGPITNVRVGDVATIFDWQDGSRPEDMSAACGSSVYDLTMHLNPLLPRKIIS